MGKIIFDYGHGGRDVGANYKGRLEKNDNLKLGQDVRKVLINHGLTVDETRSTDIYLSLQDRVDKANSKTYDYFISFHRNAFKPNQANGVETFTYTTQTPQAKELASYINKSIVEVGFKDRGVKTANFKVLRDTTAKSILIETGFIDSIVDNKIFDSQYNDIVQGISKSILQVLKVDYNNTDTFYRVVTGSYKNRSNAENQVKQLKMKGFDSFIDIYRG